MRARRGAWPRTRPLVSLTLACACVLLMLSGAVRAQSVSPADINPTTLDPLPDEANADDATRLYLGMWTTHLKHDVLTLDNNWVVGVSSHGFFGATFLNSFGRRAFAGGIQRTVVSIGGRPLAASLGCRLGLVTGYDGRFMAIARKTPVLPLVQPFVSVDVRDVGFEVSYTFVVVSIAVSYRF